MRSTLIAAAVAAASFPALQAQDAEAARAKTMLENLRVPVHRETLPDGHELGLWTAGRDWKASFHDGMTFVPYLGREYPHNQPFAWRTTSVRRWSTWRC